MKLPAKTLKALAKRPHGYSTKTGTKHAAYLKPSPALAAAVATRPLYSFMVRYRVRVGGKLAKKISELSESVYCDTVQEARRYMLAALADLERDGASIVENRTYRL